MRETKLWTWHMVAGVVILLLLGFHMAYTHVGTLLTGNADNISKELSQQRDANPLFPAFFILMLGVALYHGLYGLRGILLELCPHPPAQRAMAVALLVLGLSLFALGSFAAMKAHRRAAQLAAPAPVQALAVR